MYFKFTEVLTQPHLFNFNKCLNSLLSALFFMIATLGCAKGSAHVGYFPNCLVPIFSVHNNVMLLQN